MFLQSYLINSKNYDNTAINKTISKLSFDAFDMSNPGSISGTVDISGSVKENCTVCLFHETTNELIATTKTNSAGKFEFTQLNKSLTFYIMVKAPNNQWEHKVSSRRVPV